MRLWGMSAYIGHLPDAAQLLLDGGLQAGRGPIKWGVSISGLKYLSRLTGIREFISTIPS